MGQSTQVGIAEYFGDTRQGLRPVTQQANRFLHAGRFQQPAETGSASDAVTVADV
jgi:hypothetical protein